MKKHIWTDLVSVENLIWVKSKISRRKNKGLFARNSDSVPYLGRHVYLLTVVSVSYMYHYKNPTKHVGLVQSGPHHHFIDN